MDSARNDIIERIIDLCGASALAAAAGFATSTLAPLALSSAAAAGAASVTFILAYAVLRRCGGHAPTIGLGAFELRTIEPQPEPEALLLDDILASLGPDSRVVRMFAPDAIPTAGQLQARIDRHIASDGHADRDDEAREALHAALADIRRSLR